MSRGFETGAGAKALRVVGSSIPLAPDSQCWDYGHTNHTTISSFPFSFCCFGDGAKALYMQTVQYY